MTPVGGSPQGERRRGRETRYYDVRFSPAVPVWDIPSYNALPTDAFFSGRERRTAQRRVGPANRRGHYDHIWRPRADGRYYAERQTADALAGRRSGDRIPVAPPEPKRYLRQGAGPTASGPCCYTVANERKGERRVKLARMHFCKECERDEYEDRTGTWQTDRRTHGYDRRQPVAAPAPRVLLGGAVDQFRQRMGWGHIETRTDTALAAQLAAARQRLADMTPLARLGLKALDNFDHESLVREAARLGLRDGAHGFTTDLTTRARQALAGKEGA